MVLRILLLTGWLLVPVAGLAWHMGPGQERKALDEVAKRLRAAEAAAADRDYFTAVDEYDAYVEARAPAVDRSFSLERAWRNREYRAMTGLALAVVLLVIKAAWF